MTIKARELSIDDEEMGELLYNKLDGVMRSALMRMNVNVDEGITVATLHKVGIQLMNLYTVERGRSRMAASMPTTQLNNETSLVLSAVLSDNCYILSHK
jgi:hypothetical protein